MLDGTCVLRISICLFIFIVNYKYFIDWYSPDDFTRKLIATHLLRVPCISPTGFTHIQTCMWIVNISDGMDFAQVHSPPWVSFFVSMSMRATAVAQEVRVPITIHTVRRDVGFIGRTPFGWFSMGHIYCRIRMSKETTPTFNSVKEYSMTGQNDACLLQIHLTSLG